MPRPKGLPKTGGRQKGVPNRRTQDLELLAAKHQISPFEVLLLVAKGDWASLGYETKSLTRWTSAGIEYEEEVIPLAARLKAAAEAAQYLYPKKKPQDEDLELTQQERMLIQMFRERMKQYVEEEAGSAVSNS